MLLLVVGLNYNTAPIEILERVSSGLKQPEKELPPFYDHMDGMITLSTCNRSEIYVVADERYSVEQDVINYLHTQSKLSPAELSPYLYTYWQEAAVDHLFKIASGLDSMIVGEFEILGQVKHAMDAAKETKLASAPLIKLFQQAIWVGRHAREHTAISRNAASVSSAGIELAKKVFTDFSTCKALVIGAGEAGRLAARMLVKYKISQMTIASRTHERAVTLASSLGCNAIHIYSIREALSSTDVVISCTNSPHFTLDAPVVAEAMKQRSDRPLVIIDIAVPRDVDPAVRSITNVLLHDIDDIKTISVSNRLQREAEIESVTEIVDVEVKRFMSWWNTLEEMPVIAALVNKAEKIRQQQFEKTINKLHSLSEEDRTRIDAMTKSIISRLLHDPILCLKNSEKGSQHALEVKKLFKLSSFKLPTDQ